MRTTAPLVRVRELHVHLLAAALLAHAKLWTLDKHLSVAAEVLGVLWTD